MCLMSCRACCFTMSRVGQDAGQQNKSYMLVQMICYIREQHRSSTKARLHSTLHADAQAHAMQYSDLSAGNASGTAKHMHAAMGVWLLTQRAGMPHECMQTAARAGVPGCQHRHTAQSLPALPAEEGPAARPLPARSSRSRSSHNSQALSAGRAVHGAGRGSLPVAPAPAAWHAAAHDSSCCVLLTASALHAELPM